MNASDPSNPDQTTNHDHPSTIPHPPTVYRYLDPAFLQAMNDIGRLGFERYGVNSFTARMRIGNSQRDERLQPTTIAEHARRHFEEYLNSLPHDYYGTLTHQLAAVAHNAMMEAWLGL